MNKKLIVKTITALLIAHFMVGNIWAHGSIKDWHIKFGKVTV